jgi:GntR family transcriptional regulator
MENHELDRSKGHIPFYRQIKSVLKAKIIAEEYKYGDTIPTEIEIKGIFGVSRITSRQAIMDLEKEGYLERVRGKGTKVIFKGLIEEELSKIMSFTNEMKSRGIVPGTKYAHVTKVLATEKLATRCSCDVGDELFKIERVRTGDGIPIVYFITYVNGKYNLPLDDKQYYSSLYELCSQVGVPEHYYSTDRLTAGISDKNMAEKLEIEVNDPILIRIRRSFSMNKEVLEYTLSYYPASRYSYRITDLVKNK